MDEMENSSLLSLNSMLRRASCRIRTNDPEITNHVLWPTELKRRILTALYRPSFRGLVVKRLQRYDYFLKRQNF